MKHQIRTLAACAVMVAALVPSSSTRAAGPTLLRIPWLTDVTSTTAIVNFATDTADTANSHPIVTYGPLSAGCTGSTLQARLNGQLFSINNVRLYQWKAQLTNLQPETQYCYDVNQAGELLGKSSGIPAGWTTTFSTTRPTDGAGGQYSFAVIGDFGAGSIDETNILKQMAGASPRFVVTVGDNAYPAGTQRDYGNAGPAPSGNIFPPQFWPQLGSTPIYATQGNHGFTSYQPYLQNFPADQTVAACRAAGCRYQPEAYPADPGAPGTFAANYASAWYAFDQGQARFYMLEAAWADGNGGNGGPYKVDFDQHWNAATSAEYAWLKNDLAIHKSTPLKFAFFHYPLYADASSQGSDTYLTVTGPAGAQSLEGLLASNGVDVAFTGHDHAYERNLPQVSGTQMVNYVSGGGGDSLGAVSGCSAFDAYAIGGGHTSCHVPASEVPTSDAQAHNFLLVTVGSDSRTVTVTPTDETGRTFDRQTYGFQPIAGDIIGHVTGHLATAASQTSPIPGATITCSCGGTTQSLADGSFALRGLAPGNVTLTVAALGYTSPAATPVAVIAGSKLQQDLALADDAALVNTVLGYVGDPITTLGVAAASVTLTGCSSAIPTTDGNGRYLQSGVTPGVQCNASATKPNYSTASGSTPPSGVPANGFATVANISISAGGIISGAVTDGSNANAPISGAAITCSCGLTTVSDPNGNYSLAGIFPGTYQVSASASAYLTQTQTINVKLGANTLNFVMTLPPGQITGVVTDALTGAPLYAGVVCACNPVRWAVTAPDGSYIFDNVAPGDYPVGAFSPPGYGWKVNWLVTVTSGAATPVDFALDRSLLGSGKGYWLVASDGGIFPFGNAGGFGSTGGMHLNKPIVAMTRSHSGGGYWLVASDGGIFPFGDAAGLGSTGNIHLNRPIVGMAATPSGKGYWLVASDGGIFPFGDAGGYGSRGGFPLNQPIVGMTPTPSGKGYWLVAADGGIFPFGDAGGYGSTGGRHLNQPIVGMAASPSGKGYWLVATDGGIFPFGDAGGFGSTGGIHLNQPIVGMAPTPLGKGYWLVASDGGIFPFGDAGGFGSTGGKHLNQPIVGMAAS